MACSGSCNLLFAWITSCCMFKGKNHLLFHLATVNDFCMKQTVILSEYMSKAQSQTLSQMKNDFTSFVDKIKARY